MPPGDEQTSRIREELRRAFSSHLSALESDLRNVSNLLGQIAERVTRLQSLEIPSFGSLSEGPSAGAAVSRDPAVPLLSRLGGELRATETQEEILSLLLEGASKFAGRVALFVPREDRFLGWSSRGFSEASSERIRQASFVQSESPFLIGSLSESTARSTSDFAREGILAGILGVEASAPWLALPLKALQRPVALLVASSTAERACQVEALGLILEVAGLSIENMALRLLQEIANRAQAEVSPKAPAPIESPQPPPVSPPEVEVVESIAGDLTVDTGIQVELDSGAFEMEAPPAESAPAWQSEIAQTTSIFEESPQVETTGPDLDEVSRALKGVFKAELATEPMVEAVLPEPPAEPVVEAVLSELPVTEPAPPAPPPPAEPSPDEKLHMDAKRFARLLVSEIKLYNEQRVIEGRAHKDLYVRLKRDIDRSREMYEKRVSPVVSQKIDYFHDELIRILGENDAAKLGSDYPGPRVES